VIVGIIRRKPVLTHASMVCEGMLASVNWVNYFSEFVYDVVVKQLLGLPRFQYLLLIVDDHINEICAIIQRLFGQNKRRK